MENANEDEVPFTPSTLEDCAKRTEKLRMEFLFGIDAACAEPVAEQHYLLALSCMEQAQRYFAIARQFQVRTLAGR